MKIVHDYISGHDITIDYIKSAGVAIMTGNGIRIEEVIPRGSRGLCQALYTKAALEEFGSFFDQPLKARRAA